jgi:Leucine-rich repeat (LRR) protein
MKQLALLCLFALATLSSYAQYVSIPDSNFASYLKQLVPKAMSGNDLLTSSSELSRITQIDCSNRNIKSLEGIQYFDSLVELNCGENELKSLPSLPTYLQKLWCFENNLSALPHLPPKLIDLVCSNNQLKTLPLLPDSLIYLSCDENQLSKLPELPSSLEKLWCSTNQLTQLPSLPDSLVGLICRNNQLTSIPQVKKLYFLYCDNNKLTSLPILPSSLHTLHCFKNRLTALPALPQSLEILWCQENSLEDLPHLPSKLNELRCESNKIASLPALPSSLTELNCSENELNTLPSIPSKLEYLICSSNQITSIPYLSQSLLTVKCNENLLQSLPALPKRLRNLDCQNNRLTTLPELPQSLKTLNCYNNQLTIIPSLPLKLNHIDCSNNSELSCLPSYTQNHFQVLKVQTNTNIKCLPIATTADVSDGSDTLPVCNLKTNCPITFNVNGNVYHDTANCSRDETKHGKPIQGIKILHFEDTTLIEQTYSDKNGQFSFNVPAKTQRRIQLYDPTSTYEKCDFYSYVYRRSSSSIENGFDFGLKCAKPNLSASSIYGQFKPDSNSAVYITAGDLRKMNRLYCSSGKSGTVTTTISGSATYVSPLDGALVPSNISGNTLSYDISDFGNIDPKTAFNIVVKTDKNAVVGDEICIKTIIRSNEEDDLPIDDSLEFCGFVVKSLSTNRKSAYPNETVYPDSWLTFTIQYQNTHFDTVKNFYITDTLSKFLDESTFTYLSGSVRPTVYLKGKAVLLKYQKINLNDTLDTKIQSDGWVQYKVKTIKTIQPDDTIKNKAYIYFNSNNPITTNTTINVYSLPAASDLIHSRKEIIKVYPNPTKGSLTLEFGKIQDFTQLRIFTYTGLEVLSRSFQNKSIIELDFDANPGVYFLEVKTSDNTLTTLKIMVE